MIHANNYLINLTNFKSEPARKKIWKIIIKAKYSIIYIFFISKKIKKRKFRKSRIILN